MKIDIGPEMQFRFSRSGGKGGQNVNKVETRVEGIWIPAASTILTEEQRSRVMERLSDRMNAAGEVVVRSQSGRTQLENRLVAVERMNEWVAKALARKKARIATAPTAASRRKRMDEKRRISSRKAERRRTDGRDAD
jgi:ribosome-associated protein